MPRVSWKGRGFEGKEVQILHPSLDEHGNFSSNKDRVPESLSRSLSLSLFLFFAFLFPFFSSLKICCKSSHSPPPPALPEAHTPASRPPVSRRREPRTAAGAGAALPRARSGAEPRRREGSNHH